MSQKGAVLITGNFSFPDGNAGGKRVLGIGYILRELGYRVVFAGCEVDRSVSQILETRSVYDSFVYYSFNGSRSVNNIIDIKDAYKDFLKIVNTFGVDELGLIVLYGSPVLAEWNNRVIKFAKEKRIKVIFDCVDWIERSGFDSVLKNIVKIIDTNYMKRILAARCDGVIAVSSYLKSYYKKRGCKVVKLPPVGKFAPGDLKEKNVEPKYFIYAGGLQKTKKNRKSDLKDRIDISVEIVAELLKRGANVRFDIYGIEETHYRAFFPEHKTLLDGITKGRIVFHGKVPNDQVCEAIRKATFSLLNRDVTKVTTAGFPSKIAESLCLGTPVITSDTSDISEYITDGRNGIIISGVIDDDADKIMETINSQEKMCGIKNYCIDSCIFDYSTYRDVVSGFLREI